MSALHFLRALSPLVPSPAHTLELWPVPPQLLQPCTKGFSAKARIRQLQRKRLQHNRLRGSGRGMRALARGTTGIRSHARRRGRLHRSSQRRQHQQLQATLPWTWRAL